MSLIFGVPNFCAFSLLVLCLFLSYEWRRGIARYCEKAQKLGTPKIRDTWPFPNLIRIQTHTPLSRYPLMIVLRIRMSEPQPPLPLKKYRSTPPICIAIRFQFVLQCFWCPYTLRKGKYCVVLLSFVSQYASHLYCNTPPIRIAVLLGKSWWLWSPGCSPKKGSLSLSSPVIPHLHSWTYREIPSGRTLLLLNALHKTRRLQPPPLRRPEVWLWGRFAQENGAFREILDPTSFVINKGL